MKLTRHRLFRIVFLLICLIVAAGIVRSVVTIWEKRGLVAERKAVLEAEQAKHERLIRELREATSSAFVERAARDKLGLVREGEQIVIMEKVQNSEPNDQKELQELPSWKQWWKLFF